MAQRDETDRDTPAEEIAKSLRSTGIQSGETGGPDSDTASAPDFSFVSGASGATPREDETDVTRERKKDRDA